MGGDECLYLTSCCVDLIPSTVDEASLANVVGPRCCPRGRFWKAGCRPAFQRADAIVQFPDIRGITFHLNSAMSSAACSLELPVSPHPEGKLLGAGPASFLGAPAHDPQKQHIWHKRDGSAAAPHRSSLLKVLSWGPSFILGFNEGRGQEKLLSTNPTLLTWRMTASFFLSLREGVQW